MRKTLTKTTYKQESIWFYYLITGIVAFACLLPLWIAFAASISSEADIAKYGYGLIPRHVTFETYAYIFNNKGILLLNAFGITFLVVVLGTLFSLTVTTCFAYAASQRKDAFPWANMLSLIAWFTMVFSGGVLPWYILTTRYYGLQNNLFALFLPAALNVFFMFILKSTFKTLPYELVESAKMDGASPARIFLQIEIPLAKVGLITITLFYALQYWNDFYLSLYLITKTDLYTLQKLLYNMMANISALMTNTNTTSVAMHVKVPTNTARMAMTILSILPVLLFYPFAQKYFVKGVTIGAVKG